MWFMDNHNILTRVLWFSNFLPFSVSTHENSIIIQITNHIKAQFFVGKSFSIGKIVRWNFQIKFFFYFLLQRCEFHLKMMTFETTDACSAIIDGWNPHFELSSQTHDQRKITFSLLLHSIYCRIEKFNRNTSERIKNTNRKQMCYAVIC